MDKDNAQSIFAKQISRRQFHNWLKNTSLGMLLLRMPLGMGQTPRAKPKHGLPVTYFEPPKSGQWELTDIEGKIPADFAGTLYRVAPGQTQNHGTTLRHLFDGDPFITAYRIQGGKVSLQAQYLDTPARTKEQQAKKMLYGEFGTVPPEGEPYSYITNIKNQPNVNLVPFGNDLLGLSEGGPPAVIDPQTLRFKKWADFKGTLPQQATFTAHPKEDPTTGDLYGFGFAQGMAPNMNIYKIKTSGKVETLYQVKQDQFPMVHDMAITENYLIFAKPPVFFNFQIMGPETSLADILQYASDKPCEILMVAKDGKSKPRTFKLPPQMVFHHGNAFEKDGQIQLDIVSYPDDAIFRALWMDGSGQNVKVAPSQTKRVVLDLQKGTAQTTKVWGRDHEFPQFDRRFTGRDTRYSFYTAADYEVDPHTNVRLDKVDHKTGQVLRKQMEPGQYIEEALFHPKRPDSQEGDGWLIYQGYDHNKGRNYIAWRDAQTLALTARAWAPTRFPLGFHGCLVTG